MAGMQEENVNEEAQAAISVLEEEMARYPSAVLEEFRRAREPMAEALNDAQLGRWASLGAEVAAQNVRSWEAAAQYFKVSPEVAGYMPFNYFVKWADCGTSLCRDSPSLATAFFHASPATTRRLRSRHIESWASLGRGLYKGTWKSSTLACKFYGNTPGLLESLTFQELGRFVTFLDGLAHRSYDLAAECLVLGQRIFPLIGDDKDAFISLASTLSETGWRQVKSFFEAGSRALPRIDPKQRLRFMNMAERLVRSGGTNIPNVMLEISQALATLDSEHHSRILNYADSALEVSPGAVPEFIKSSPTVLSRVSMNQLGKWFGEGMSVLEENKDGGLAFFKLESAYSEKVLEMLSSGVEFERVKDVLQMYCRALAGAEIKIAESQELVGKNIGWVSGEAPSTEGSTVFLPTVVDRYGSKDENFAWFKVVSTHQVAHLEFGSFGFEFERPSSQFDDIRQQVLESREGLTTTPSETNGASDNGAGGLETAWLTDMQRYFDLFDDRKLALDIFTVVEDGRLDGRVRHEYPGIRRSYQVVQSDSVENRPDIQELPMKEAMVEFLVRLSLQQYKGIPAPKQYVTEARKIAAIAQQVVHPEAMVEDAAEATLRIYALISQIPNEENPEDNWEDLDLEDDQEQFSFDEEDLEMLLSQFGQAMQMSTEGEGEEEYESSQDVDYRGDFKPELVQLLSMLRMQNQDKRAESTEAISQEMLEEMLKNSAELDLQAVQGDVDESSGLFADNMMREAGMNMPATDQYGQGPLVHVDEQGDSLDPTEPQTFVYDEWDFRANDYKPRWCIVRQKPMAEGDSAYYANTVHSYGTLVTQIRRQFEMMVPEMFRKVRKLEDGEDLDIDDVIEAFVDIRTGASPSDKLFWRRNKVQRDVAVVFLLDTSASTAEAIDDSKRAADDWDAPEDPVEYMVWLRSRRSEGVRRGYKRIIDVEKESVVLLINALEAIGDLYGIYGFSGYGRENVEFYTIKDIEENFSERVKGRIDRIAPLHATRMGPAIRHAASKLESQDARTKLLFLISDGRPQDRGYSREGVEKEYAVHDTKMAFDEARLKDIQPFCLTVDKNGHDYLGTMCQDIGYEVLDDIYALPQRLLYLYKTLTM